MKSCIMLLVRLFTGILSLFLIPSSIYANELLNENFQTLNTNYWSINSKPNDTVNIMDNSILHLSSDRGTSFPYIYLKNVVIPEKNYDISVKFKYLGTYDYGSGIIFSNKTLQYETPSDLQELDVLFHIWPNSLSSIGISSSICSNISTNCADRQNSKIITSVNLNTWNTIEINSDGNNVYQVHLNGDLIYTTKPSQLKISTIWFGNPQKTSTTSNKPELFLDYVKIFDNNSASIQKTIIIPGLGASWNISALLSGRDEGEWLIPSFINNYDGLINSFKNAGYLDSGSDKNLFVFSYDWRRPLDTLADRLNSFINSNSPDQKVNLVGHSMGGLVARAYAQKYGSSKINKLVTVGSPNKGTVKAYGAWEGAMLFDESWWSKVALELTTHFGMIAGESNIQTVQRTVPSLKDLLPTYEFLVFGNNAPISISSSNKNSYLDNLNNNISGIDSISTAIYSDNIDTDSLVKVVQHTDGDLGTWIDGKPIDNPFVKTFGDGTVTDFSAKGSFSNTLLGIGWHGELVTKIDNIQKIFSVLGLDESKVLSGVDDSRDRVFVAALRSPGILEVCNENINKCNDDLGYFDPNNKIFIFPGYEGEGLIVNVRENGTGDYKLHLGNINEQAYWTEVSGKLNYEDQLDTYNILSNNQVLVATLVDEVPPTTPTITGFKNPALPCGSITNRKYNTVDWSDSTDNYELAGYEYFVDYPLPNGTGRSIWNPTTLWTKSENYGSLNEGVHYIKVRAKDKSGNVSSWSNTCEITYDSITPELESLTEFSGWYSTSQTSTFKYYDVNLRHDYIDPSCIISTEGIAQTCSISPNVCDMAGNCNTDTQISNGANIDFTLPRSPRIFANDWGHMIWVGWMPIKDAIKYRVYYGIDKNELYSFVETRNSYWFSKNLPQGKYFVQVTSVDRAGNESLKSNVEKVIIKKHWWNWSR